jgi:glycosyltransferase involved in cell wall biosynthesis
VTSGNPTVSVCIPAFNAERWIERAVRSALEQTYADLEVVVVDNASTDGTRRRVRQIDDPRVRLHINSHNLGPCRNFNKSFAVSRGRYLKFLCADDYLHLDCVKTMLRVFESDPKVGLVFSPRAIELADRNDAAAVAWKQKHERTHTRFGQLHEINDGETLLAAWIEGEFRSNWIGEPSNVMMSRECLRHVGTFNCRLREQTDMELWARAMLFYSVGFVDRPLSTFLVHADSGSSVNRKTGQAWLDRLWLFEGLLSHVEMRQRHPEVRRLRTRAFVGAFRDALFATTTAKRGRIADLGRYLAFRARSRRGASRLHGSINDCGDHGETVEFETSLATRGSA